MGKFMMKLAMVCVALALVSILIVGCAEKEVVTEAPEVEFPTKPLTWVVAWPAGGGSDAWGRLCGKHLEESIGQPVVVQNIDGSSTMLALADVLKKPADGYTIVQPESASARAKALEIEGPEPLADFTMLGGMMGGGMTCMLLVRDDSNLETFEDFVAECQAKPGELKVGVSSLGGAWALPMFMLRDEGVDCEIVPMGGGAPVLTGLLSGDLELGISGVGTVVEYVGEDVEPDLRLRPLCSFNYERITDYLPDVPTCLELGYDVAHAPPLYAAVRADTPAEIVELLRSSLEEALTAPEFAEELSKMGYGGMRYLTPKECIETYLFDFEMAVRLKALGVYD